MKALQARNVYHPNRQTELLQAGNIWS